jgi:hypothetical protein
MWKIRALPSKKATNLATLAPRFSPNYKKEEEEKKFY